MRVTPLGKVSVNAAQSKCDTCVQGGWCTGGVGSVCVRDVSVRDV